MKPQIGGLRSRRYARFFRNNNFAFDDQRNPPARKSLRAELPERWSTLLSFQKNHYLDCCARADSSVIWNKPADAHALHSTVWAPNRERGRNRECPQQVTAPLYLQSKTALVFPRDIRARRFRREIVSYMETLIFISQSELSRPDCSMMNRGHLRFRTMGQHFLIYEGLTMTGEIDCLASVLGCRGVAY